MVGKWPNIVCIPSSAAPSGERLCGDFIRAIVVKQRLCAQCGSSESENVLSGNTTKENDLVGTYK